MDGAQLKPRSMKAANEDDVANANEDDSIDGTTMRATKRGRGPQESSSFMGGETDEGAANRDGAGGGNGGGGLARGQAGAGRNNIGPDDDATIQRKSTNLDDDSVDEPPARLKARGK